MILIAAIAAASVLPIVPQEALPPVAYPALPARAATVQGFVPRGWVLEQGGAGDLNGDGRVDQAFVLHMADAANRLPAEGMCGETDTNPRILAVALAERTGGYRLVVQDHVLIPRYDNSCAEDWFASDSEVAGGLRVERGHVVVELGRFMNAGGWGMGSTRFTFAWRDAALRLIGYDRSDIHRGSGQETELSIDFPARRVRMEHGWIGGGKRDVRHFRLRAGPLPTIAQVGDGFAYDPDGMVARADTIQAPL